MNDKYNLDRSASVLILMAETPVHAGAAEGKATLDLPIQRSVQTDWPILNDTTVRGGLRSHVANTDPQLAVELFGTEEGKARHAGRFSTPDAELLLFPVSSPVALTAWVTCPKAIRMFQRKTQMAAGARMLSDGARKANSELEALAGGLAVEANEALTGGKATQFGSGQKVLLESDVFDVKKSDAGEKFATWLVTHLLPLTDDYWKNYTKERIVVVPDNAFTHYVQRKTDIRTRIKVGDEGAAENLFTEENLPVDSILYTILLTTDAGSNEERGKGYLAKFRWAVKMTDRPVIQLGGDQSLGRGMVRLRELEG